MIIQCPDHYHSNPASTRDQKSASNELGRRLVTLNLIIQTLWVNDRLQIRVSYGARSANWNGNSKVVAKPVTTSGRWDISIISCELHSHRCSMVSMFYCCNKCQDMMYCIYTNRRMTPCLLNSQFVFHKLGLAKAFQLHFVCLASHRF